MNNYDEVNAECSSPAKDFENIVFKIQGLVSFQESRLAGLQKLRDKLVGQQLETGEAIPMPKSNVPLDSFQGQIEEAIVNLNRIGYETDKVLETLHNKI